MDIIEDINNKNQEFINNLVNKDAFMFDWHEGAVLPLNHPHYYDGRVSVTLKQNHDGVNGNINIGTDEYPVTDDIVNKLYDYIEANIEKMIKLSLNQTSNNYFGVTDNMMIKYKTVFITISGPNASTDEERKTIDSIKEDIKQILTGK